jgi:subtilisin family serine protease
MNRAGVALFAFLTVASTSLLAAPLPPLPMIKHHAPGRVLLKPADKRVNATPATQRAFVAQLAQRSGVALKFVRPMALGWLYLDVEAMTDEAATVTLAKRLSAVPGVAAATVDVVQWQRRLPDDPLLSLMWHVDAMNLPAAWDVSTGTGSTRVAVVDSGVVAHEDLDGALTGGLDFIDDPSISNDGDGRDNDPFDDCSSDTGLHGTHVSGTIGARGNNGIGVVGANWVTPIIPVRALGVGAVGLSSDIGEGAFWAAGGDVPGVTSLTSSTRARVINLSLGGASGDACNAFYIDIFSSIAASGAIAVAAAGNEGGPVESPGNCPGVVAVAASNIDNELTNYSSFGAEVAIVAPGGQMDVDIGEGIISTLHESLSSFQDGSPYGFLEGTSMATPSVSGVVALMLDVDASLQVDDVISILQQTGNACGRCGNKVALDAGAALALVAGGGGGGGGGGGACDNSCQFANDGECDDGRAAAATALCAADTDCNDCEGGGVVGGGGGGGGGGNDDDEVTFPPLCTEETNSCQYAFDSECDEGGSVCADGTDSADCGDCYDDGSVGPPPLCGSHAGAPAAALGVTLLMLRRRRSAR